MKLQPALLGGLFIGVLSSLPIVQAGNCCCCLWVILGGILTVYLQKQRTGGLIDAGQGALAGALAGLIGGVIAAIAGFALQQITGTGYDEMLQMMLADENMPPEARQMLERLSGGVLAVVISFVTVIGSIIFGMIGGLLGVAIFKKNTPPPPPPPPYSPSYPPPTSTPPTVIPHDPGTAQ